MKTKITDKLIVALDTSSEKEALDLIEKLGDEVTYYKIGLELFTSVGPKIIKAVKDQGKKVFFDGKFSDIPNTVSKAVSNMVHHKVDMLNIYMSGGAKMIHEAKNALNETAQKYSLQPPKLLGVTVLTSLTGEELKGDFKIQAQIDEYVLHLALLALKNNLDGIISSPHEARKIHDVVSKEKKDFLIVTPGVRPSWADKNDQVRTATPKEAIKNGATHIVVGRPITGAKDPKDAAKKILIEIEEATKN